MGIIGTTTAAAGAPIASDPIPPPSAGEGPGEGNYGTMLLQLPPHWKVADKQDLSPMQASHVSAACLTLGSLAARERQLLRQLSTL